MTTKIDPKATMHGVPTLIVRKILRRIPRFGEDSYGVSWDEAVGHDLSSEISERLFSGLREDGYVVPTEVDGEVRDGLISCTKKGSSLAMATARPLKRVTADKMLAAVMERAKVINADDRFCYRVDALIVFGSYLNPDKQILGDLDIAYIHEARYSRIGWEDSPMERAKEASRDRAIEAGRNFSWYWERLCWPEKEFRLALKARTRGLSLHDAEGSDQKAVFRGPHRIVFGEISARVVEAMKVKAK